MQGVCCVCQCARGAAAGQFRISSRMRQDSPDGSPPDPCASDRRAAHRADVVVDARSVLSVCHWERIGRGLPYAATSAVAWAILHARTFDHDVRSCGRCSPRLRVRAVIVDMEVAGQILKGPVRLAGERGAEGHGCASGQLDAVC